MSSTYGPPTLRTDSKGVDGTRSWPSSAEMSPWAMDVSQLVKSQCWQSPAPIPRGRRRSESSVSGKQAQRLFGRFFHNRRERYSTGKNLITASTVRQNTKGAHCDVPPIHLNLQIGYLLKASFYKKYPENIYFIQRICVVEISRDFVKVIVITTRKFFVYNMVRVFFLR